MTRALLIACLALACASDEDVIVDPPVSSLTLPSTVSIRCRRGRIPEAAPIFTELVVKCSRADQRHESRRRRLAMTDRALLAELLESTKLSELEQEAFASMAEWLDGGNGRGLSEKQRDWVRAAALAKGICAEETKNLYSAGLVPRGIPTKKTAGEEFAAGVLANRPMRPPGRTA